MPNIASGNTIAEVASLIGDAARANILSELMGGRALTAGELARHAGVTAQTTSGHLAKLSKAKLIVLEKQGRHRYYRLASEDVAQVMHSLMAITAAGPKRHRPVGPRDEALRMARTCYDHPAGRLALAVTDSLCEREYVVIDGSAAEITKNGARFFTEFGLDLAAMDHSKRPICKPCLDWSERRPHLAGQLGAALLDRVLDLKWVTRRPESRALKITTLGRREFSGAFELSPDWWSAS
jgi:DNA-binding transcriptional ArsR family regulator